jgi:hypothetical protein
MISVRLPNNLEEKLEKISIQKNISKSEIIKIALSNYLDDYYSNSSLYDLGKDFFGKYGSGEKNNSKNYKNKLKDKLIEKYNH